MLESIKVKNVALIHEAELSLGEGLNVLTGETGAGKSILIDSIHLALGGRADRGLIRQGADHAYVELFFSVDGEQEERLARLGVQSDDGTLILTRRLEESRNVCRINGEVVTGKMLRQVASLLIDVHTQQEHISLLQEKKHLEILDLYAGSELAELKEEIGGAYDAYREVLAEYEEAAKEDGLKERELDLARYECEEIDKAELTEGEDDELEAEFRKLTHAMSITESVSAALEGLDGSGMSGLELVGMALGRLKEAQRYDDFSEQTKALLQAEELIRQTSRELSRYLEDDRADEERMAFVGERLDLINRLKKKYGSSIEQIQKYGDERRNQIERLEDYDRYLSELSERKERQYQALIGLCDRAHKIREQAAGKLEEELKEALSELGFSHCELKIEAVQEEDRLGRDGNDHASFLISFNAGESLRPLTDVASGGELSRVMLAVKSILADTDRIPTMIFDEIDAGISGQTAWRVSEKMAVIRRKHQLICITHLPQIAAMADCHFRIEKTEKETSTKTQITALDREGMIEEVARLLGSDTISDSALANAKELKEKADGSKHFSL